MNCDFFQTSVFHHTLICSPLILLLIFGRRVGIIFAREWKDCPYHFYGMTYHFREWNCFSQKSTEINFFILNLTSLKMGTLHLTNLTQKGLPEFLGH